jgi:sugar (pentulose or hexulose) kinase
MSTGAVSLGIDLGTGSVKAVLLDQAGKQVAVASAPVGLQEPQQGWAESDPEQWWAAVECAVRRALGGRNSSVVAVGLSGQMHGVVLSGSDANPLRPAIVSLDRRALPDLDAYRAMPPELTAALGNPLVPGTAGPILHWLARSEPAILQNAVWALQPKDWLRMRLTGEAGSEPSDASGTLLFDLGANTWAWRVVEALGLLELAHGRADLIRAAFEGVAFSIVEAAEALPETALAQSVYLAGGGTLHPSWRQLLSDALGKALLVVGDPNASARGAALLGWRAAHHECPSALGPEVSEKVEPDEAARSRLAAALERWKEAATQIGRPPA